MTLNYKKCFVYGLSMAIVSAFGAISTIPKSGRRPVVWLTATLRTDAGNALMTARLFCEGSGRDKQIAQESSIHKDGRTEPECHAAGQRKRCQKKRRQHKSRQPRQHNYKFASTKNYTPIYIGIPAKRKASKSQAYECNLMHKKAKMAKNGLEKVKRPFHKSRNDLKKTPWCSRQNTL
jgi:hypothetical protein